MKKLICLIFGHKKEIKERPLNPAAPGTIVKYQEGVMSYQFDTKNIVWRWWECKRCGANNKTWGVE